MAAAFPNSRRLILTALAAWLVLTSSSLRALTLPELLEDDQMTPKRFASFFEDFAYEYSVPVQPAEQFLGSRRGDCDDYAVLADYVLSRRKLSTRLIHVRMVGRVAHAVCYVTENRAYLDYNNRRVFFTLARSGSTLREIANKVADSLDANWTSVSEFTFAYATNKKQFGLTVVKTDPPAQDPDLARGDQRKS